MTPMKYRIRYWYRKALAFIGICSACYCPINFLPRGGGVCSNCRKRY